MVSFSSFFLLEVGIESVWTYHRVSLQLQQQLQRDEADTSRDCAAESARAWSTAIHSAQLLLRKKIDGRFLPLPNPPSLRGRFAIRDVCEGEPALQASIGEGRGALGSSCQAIISDGRLWVVLHAFERPGNPRHPTQKGLYLYTLLTNICYFYFLYFELTCFL